MPPHGDAHPGPLGRLAQWTGSRPALVALLLLALAAVSGAFALPPRVTTSAAALLPADHPQGAALTRLSTHPGATGALVLTVEGDLERLDEAVTRIEALPTVLSAQHNRDPARLTLALLQAPPKSVEKLRSRIEGALAMGPMLNPLLAATLLDDEETAALLRQAESLEQGRIWVVPRHHSLDAEACVRVVRDVTTALQAVQGLELVHQGGPYANVAVGNRDVERDLARTSALSLLLVLSLLTLGFRSLRIPLALGAILAVCALVHLAVLAVLFTAITGYAMLGTAVLFGLGVDIAIHLIERVRERLSEDASIETALRVAWDGTGPACVIATLTSAASFAALAVGDFRGLAQLGISLAVSLLACTAVMLVALPALLTVLHRQGALTPRAVRVAPGWPAPGRVVAGAFLALTLAAGFYGTTNLTFEYDFSVMGSDAHRYGDKPAAIRAAMDAAEPPMVAPASALEDLEALHADGRLVGVGRILSAATILPADQGERLAELRRLAALAEHPALQTLGPRWSDALERLATLPLQPLTDNDLPHELRGVLDAGQVLLLPDRSLHDMRASAALVDALADAAPKATGVRLLQGASYQVILADAPRILAVACGAIVLFTLFGLRRPWSVALALMSVAAGGAWSVAALAALDVRLTIGNLVGFPILVGVGIDVAIHVVHRMHAEAQRFPAALGTVGRAAALSTATTTVSFGALSIASMGGLRSMGLLVGVGLPLLTLGALVLLGVTQPEGDR